VRHRSCAGGVDAGDGIGLGFITYALAKIIAGKFAQAKPAVLVLAALFVVKFAIAG
jgi:AGZA family xanthine/uracil permease-like MFS transporter